MLTSWRPAAIGLDIAVVLCAGFNLCYFAQRAIGGTRTPSRRLAALALTLVSLAALVESLFFLALLALTSDPDAGFLPWMLVRLLPFAASAFISLLVLRRLASG